MMRNLPAPTMNAVTIFNNIICDKTKKFSGPLRRVRPKVKRAYENYIANANILERLSPSGIKGVREDALIHAYGSATKTMNSLRDQLLSPDLEDFDECPYCGISEPRTLDHYLPKDKFPEFAVFPCNLIPICNICNSDYKGSKFISAFGDRLFLHSYFDTFPISDFISIDVCVANDITIEFNSVKDINNPYFSDIFANHFEKLNLKSRFLIKSAAEISRKRSALKRFYMVNANYHDVANELRNDATDLRSKLSGNHWRVALYEGLAASVEFCDGGFMKIVRKNN